MGQGPVVRARSARTRKLVLCALGPARALLHVIVCAAVDVSDLGPGGDGGTGHDDHLGPGGGPDSVGAAGVIEQRHGGPHR